MTKTELTEMLAYLQTELEAREIVISSLKAEKSKQLYCQAKYGRLSNSACVGGDPFQALQRDSEVLSQDQTGSLQDSVNGSKNQGAQESSLRSVYDNQLTQLENLIASQRKAQSKMREQLTNMEKKYLKACADLEEERRKHEHDAAQGDDVLVMLEKDRERLKSELEYEKNQNRKLEKDSKKYHSSLDEEKKQAASYKQVALALIKHRHQLEERLKLERLKFAQAEEARVKERNRMREVVTSLLAEWKRTQSSEAGLEQKLGALGQEHEEMQMKMDKEVALRRDLEAELNRVRSSSSNFSNASIHISPVSSNAPHSNPSTPQLHNSSIISSSTSSHSVSTPTASYNSPLPSSTPVMHRSAHNSTPPSAAATSVSPTTTASNTPPTSGSGQTSTAVRQKPDPPIRRTPESNVSNNVSQISVGNAVHMTGHGHHHHPPHHHAHYHHQASPPPINNSSGVSPPINATNQQTIQRPTPPAGIFNQQSVQPVVNPVVQHSGASKHVGPSPTITRKSRQIPTANMSTGSSTVKLSGSSSSTSRITPPSKLGAGSSNPGAASHLCVNGK